MRKRILSLMLVLCMTISLFAMPINTSAATEGKCGDNLTWTLDDNGTLTISGTGDMWNWEYSDYDAVWRSNRDNIKSVIIGNSVTSIGDNAFMYCSSLESLEIGNSVTSIGKAAFGYCRSLESVKIPNSVTNIGVGVFDECTSLETIEIPNSVTSIGALAFYSCINLKKVDLPNNLTSIGENAFGGCRSLTSIEIPSSVTSICHNVFLYCTSLTSIDVKIENKKYASIDGVLFNKEATTILEYPAGKDTVYTVPSCVTTIGNNAFYECSSLTNIEIPNSVTSIGDYAFGYCKSLESIEIPNSVTRIGYYAFGYCESLENIEIPNSVTSISGSMFERCDRLTNVKISNSVTSIGDFAFAYCSNLTNIEIPDSVTSIGEVAFGYCGNLESIKIPDSVISLGSLTFTYCESLTSIEIPNSVISVGVEAFYACESLKDVYYDGSEVEWNEIEIGDGNEPLTNAKIHYSNTILDKNEPSHSTSERAPIIKSVELEYNNACYDILKQKVTVDVGSSSKATLKATIDWNGASTYNRRVYITQGGQTNKGSGISFDFNNQSGEFEDIILGSKLKPDMPVYILAMDELTGQSTSVLTKIDMIDLSADDVYQEVKEKEGANFKLGQDMEFTIPDDVPLVGGAELTWKINPVPITVAYESNDKMAVIIGLDVDKLEEDGITKFDGLQFKEFKTMVDDYKKSLDKYKDGIIEAYSKQNRTLSQLRNDFRMSEANKLKNKGLTMSAWGGKVLKSTGSGELDGGVEALGYAEVNREDGKWNWKAASGYVLFQVKIEYEYNGQAFIWVVPVCYSFGGEAAAGAKITVKGMSDTGFVPYFMADLFGKLELFVSGGVGVSKVANFNAKASGELGISYPLSDYSTTYHEVLLDGKVDLNVVLLGQVVGSLNVADLADEYGVIYSENPDKYEQSWIKPDSVKPQSVELMSLNEQLELYSADRVYKNESRDYLEKPMEWHGDKPDISLFAADYTNKNLTQLAESVYTQAQPQIFSVNGKKILIFTTDNEDRTATNKQMLVYSVYNDEDATWSAPVPVADDGTADFYPSVSGEYLVWQNQKSNLEDGLSLAEIGKQGEIVIAKWNGNGFDTPVSLTDNNALDTLPKVSVNNDEISVVWLKNSADDILGVEGDTSIVKKVFNGNSWGEETVLKNTLNAVTDLSIGYYNNVLQVAYVHDVDDNITTVDDREIYLINSSEKKITDNKVLDSNAIINNGKLYWYSENNIHFMNLDESSVSTVFEDERYTLADGFTVSENDGNIAILWSGSEENSSEIKGVLYQDGAWGDVITVSELGAYAKYPTCVLEEDGTILTSFTAESDNVTSLYTLGLFPSYNLEVANIHFTESNLTPNSENEFEVNVTNNGELPVTGYTINVYNGDESLNSSVVVDDTIKAGETKAVVAKFVTGDTINYETLKIEIAMNDNEEYIYENNTTSLIIGNGDVSLESVAVYEMMPTSYAVANVANIGYSDISDITVNLRADSDDGEIIQSKTISYLAVGGSEEVTFDYTPANYENTRWYITVETDADEVSEGNNDDYFINTCATDLEDYEISVLNYSYSESQFTVNGFAKNNTEDVISGIVYAAVYDSTGKLKGVTKQAVQIDGYSDTGVDMWINDYQYEDGDYVKVFLWDNSIRPLCDMENVMLEIL